MFSRVRFIILSIDKLITVLQISDELSYHYINSYNSNVNKKKDI